MASAMTDRSLSDSLPARAVVCHGVLTPRVAPAANSPQKRVAAEAPDRFPGQMPRWLRREDATLVSGRSIFSADVRPDGALHIAFVRSVHASGRLTGIETQAARAVSGVEAIFTAEDIGALRIPAINPLLPLTRACSFDLLARDWVNWVGQPVAIVVAATREQARAAADLVQPVVEPSQASGDFDEAEPIAAIRHRWGDVDRLRGSPEDVGSVDIRLRSPRLVAMSLEPRAVTVAIDADGLTVWVPSQSPSRARDDIAATLGIAPEQVRVIAQNVGGAFGARASVVPEDLLVPWVAQRLKRSVRWVAERTEEFLAGMHGRGSQMAASLSFDSNGVLSVLSANLTFGLGAWMPFSSVVPLRNAARILPGPYRVRGLSVDGVARLSNAAPVNIYRGAGRPEAALLMECLLDRAARVLRLDPLEMRRRNLIGARAMPFRTPTGEVLDSGDYPALLERAAQLFAYDGARHEQTRRRSAGELVGIGIALYVEPCGQGWEAARVTLHADGRAEVASGAPAQGQGHLTTFARIAADELGCDPSLVEVSCGDTALCPDGVGALASRSTAIGGSAIVAACREAMAARAAGAAFPVVVEQRFTAQESWASGCVICSACIDPETGMVTIERIVWVDDAGRVVHPELAHGQLMGGLAQGLGQALMEQIVYDAGGQLLTGSLMDYAVPRAGDIPPVIMESLSNPSPHNLLGAKGVGEAGCIGVPAAIMNAARDALSPLGEIDLQFPLTPPRVWRALRDARASAAAEPGA